MMNPWLNQVLRRSEQIDDWLSPQRRESVQNLRDRTWPTQKTEAWKYTPLRSLSAFESSGTAEKEHIEPHADIIPNFDCIELPFFNGNLQPHWRSQTLPKGITVYPLSELTQDHQFSILSLFGKVKPPRHYFGLVNDALCKDGVMIEINEGAEINRPIHIFHQFSREAEAHTRILVRLKNGARISIVEHFSGSEKSINTCFSEYELNRGAQLDHNRFALQGGESINVGGCHFRLEENSKLNSNIIGFGSELSRLDVDIIHAGVGAEARLQGIYLLDHRELFDLHTNIEHRVPQCVTEETVRGIAGGEARAVFNGRIHIWPHAQKTLAELNNRNLLLSNRAEIDTKPELEIYADDVRCAHGATVAKMDEKSLYYLQSRGIDRRQARVMLNFAFINQLLDKVENSALTGWLRQQLRSRFLQMVD